MTWISLGRGKQILSGLGAGDVGLEWGGSGREGKEFEDRQLELRTFVEWYGNLVQ